MTKQLFVGKVPVGGGAPVSIQSMCNTKTDDVAATVAQIKELEAAGVTEGALSAAFQPEHYYLTPDGFVFWYQPGELGAGSSPVELPVPYSALKEYLVEWIAS